MYSKDTDTHEYLPPNSCHPKHVTNNILTAIVTRCHMKCSDSIENVKLFNDTFIYYKAYLMKSGYKEAVMNKKFINFAIKKKRKSKNKQSLQKYRFVTNFETSFPDIAKGFRKFKRMLEDDEELMEVFPHGVKHFQVTQKRGCKNMKEILGPSTVKISHEQPNNSTTVETNNGSHPCGKPCVYCYALGKSETDTFKSTSNGQSFKIRQN